LIKLGPRQENRGNKNTPSLNNNPDEELEQSVDEQSADEEGI
jgi:hypothetical protein